MIRKVVIADDDAKVILVIGEVLADLGFQVFDANEGNKAFELILREKPDLLIADILMPGLDGVALCEKVKRHPELESTKVILMTGVYKNPSFRAELDCNADAFIEKPVDIKQLAGILLETFDDLR